MKRISAGSETPPGNSRPKKKPRHKGGASGTYVEHFAVFAVSAGNGGSAVSPQAKKRSRNAVARERSEMRVVHYIMPPMPPPVETYENRDAIFANNFIGNPPNKGSDPISYIEMSKLTISQKACSAHYR